jgi:hypothetical protein
MPISHTASGILGGQWCLCHQTGPHHSPLHSLPREIGVRHRYAGRRPNNKQNQTISTVPISHLTRVVGHDASHRAKRKETHLTHWLAADFLGLPRVRSGCASLAHRVFRAIPRLIADTRRVRAEGVP